MVNVHRPSERSIIMPGAVSFVLREWAGRKHNPALCYSPIEPSHDNNEGYFLKPIPELTLFNPISSAHFNSISPTRSETCIDTRTLPSPTTFKPIHDANPQNPGQTDNSDFDVSDSAEEDATHSLEQDLTSRHHRVRLDMLKLAGLSDEGLSLASAGRQDGSDYHCQVRLVATKSREFTPPMTWARIGNIFGLNGGIMFRHVTEDRWTRRAVDDLPVCQGMRSLLFVPS
jgi:hypothetical protein